MDLNLLIGCRRGEARDFSLMLTSKLIGEEKFAKAYGFKDVLKLRKPSTRDIVRRLGVLSPHRIHISNYPAGHPAAVFNASVDVEGDIAHMYARIIVGYYMYASAVVRIDVPVDDIIYGYVNINYYSAEPEILPSTKYDIWGVEDPRVYHINGRLVVTYAGRTVNYFNPAIRRERTLPVTAVKTRNSRWDERWHRILVHILPNGLREKLISDKDAFLVTINSNMYIFHRPHLVDEYHYLTISKVADEKILRVIKNPDKEPIEVESYDTVWVMPHTDFEIKLGWATPPIKVDAKRVIALIHAVDSIKEVYRVFAVQLSFEKEGIVVEAVTPNYIMEPREPYEVYGDRPYVVFPCGLARLSQNEILITYGAADYMVGIGTLDLGELLAELDKGRIY